MNGIVSKRSNLVRDTEEAYSRRTSGLAIACQAPEPSLTFGDKFAARRTVE